ncbi:hypothetical protein SNEBB_000369 [Seison nebaliae]|nr:hypothetical protein SNEBB_000369 [Seison nebaliae]
MYLSENILILTISRIIIFIIGFISSSLPTIFPPTDVYVTNMKLYNLTIPSMEAFRKWDAIHFIDIGDYGYRTDRMTAFFPGYPLILKLMKNFLQIDLMCCGILINFTVNIISMELLIELYKYFKWTKKMSKLECRLICLLFSFNPATIFFFSSYSESMFFFLTILSITLMFGRNKFYLSLIPLFIASFIRSNNFLYLIITGSYLFSELYHRFIHKKNILFSLAIFSFKLSLSILIIFIPLFSYQAMIYSYFCQLNIIKIFPFNLLFPNSSNISSPSWCSIDSLMKHLVGFPISYSYIQSKYWNVGFLRFYEMKQFFNFIMASPIFYLSGRLISNYRMKKLCCDMKKLIFFNYNHFSLLAIQRTFFSISILLQFIICLIIGLTFIHIQVNTRFLLSSSPFLLLTLVDYLSENLPKMGKDANYLKIIEHLNKNEKFIFYFFSIYFIGGTFAFCQFLPFV